MEWITAHWRELASDAFAVSASLTVLVTMLGKWAGWRGAEKVSKALTWVHDRLSPFALGNQDKLSK